MKLLFFILYSAFALVSGDATTELPEGKEPENIIANGYEAFEGKAPYLVTLVLGSEGSYVSSLCGGAIIANNWVLTAAQCLTRDYVMIHYGSNIRARGQFSYRVGNRDFHVRPEWPTQRGFNIGLIRTPYVEFTYWINKVNLPRSCYDRFDDKWAVACGWGEQANGQLADRLQCVDLEIMSQESCSRFYKDLPSTSMCARTPNGRSTCPGDTGGPLVTYDNPTVVGVVSFFSPISCTAGHPAGFTNVATHLNWILSKIRGN